ncbi:hypothetical protein DC522_26960 [Microvirga sp. KLBC 81]|uniref:hypothetical protein n=1 Tax=Microvirga sp. KLBC 81 TaxID=1862707 RepID=UPI000D512483|nr:hypothetical protein [Microvirga sp. KLBC 81]PVE21356.1 hypothetical protein DC522_26960 [Microvirga sp. KLBC 81]
MTIIGRLITIFALRALSPIVAYRYYAVAALALIVAIIAAPSFDMFLVLFPAIGLISGCLFPTNLALASVRLDGEFEAFISRSTVVGGVALLVFPLALGSLAQFIGIQAAFVAVSLTSMLIVLAILAALTGNSCSAPK